MPEQIAGLRCVHIDVDVSTMVATDIAVAECYWKKLVSINMDAVALSL